MKKINIGLVGFGTVGSGVYELLRKNSKVIAGRTDFEISITSICDLRLDEVAKQVSGIHLTNDWKELVNDPEIHTIVELIGGIEPAKTIITEALKKGKNVVTANKKLLAEDGEGIFKLADKSNVKLGFEASVGGGIPCLDALKSGLVANQVNTVMGILNGTTNYILTRMDEAGLSFEDALAEAQKEGFAETDPTFDIEGYDAGHKITLLGMLAFNKNINYKSVAKEGITRLSKFDIIFAREMGYVIKLLGIAKNVDGMIDIRVHPTMIRKDHPLASVRREFNAIMFDSDMTGPVILYGKGAGSLPTASAVMSDIVKIAYNAQVESSAIKLDGKADILPPEKRSSRYYFRMHTEDSPGVLEKVAGAFAKNKMSIASVVQKEKEGSDMVKLIIMTHSAGESNMNESLKVINEFPFIKEKVVVIRVED